MKFTLVRFRLPPDWKMSGPLPPVAVFWATMLLVSVSVPLVL